METQIQNSGAPGDVEVSVIIPCLNERDSIGICVDKAQESLKNMGVKGEIIVVDNGSTDGSAQVAEEKGARVFIQKIKGYGSALRRGFEEAKGQFLIMADGDDTYDLRDIPRFIKPLKENNCDFVIGSRLDGNILPKAMTFTHRYIGNPVLSGMLRLFFGGNIPDSQCGMRSMTRTVYRKMQFRTLGMEFASEMIIQALQQNLKILSLPISYFPRKGESKLDGWRDAWRHVRFMVLFAPEYLYLLPGVSLFFLGIALLVQFVLGQVHFMGRTWSIHLALFSSMMAIIGWEIILLGYSAKVFLSQVRLSTNQFTNVIKKIATLERMLGVGIFFFFVGASISMYIVIKWINRGFGALAEIETGIFALTLISIGIQTMFHAFFSTLLQIRFSNDNAAG